MAANGHIRAAKRTARSAARAAARPVVAGASAATPPVVRPLDQQQQITASLKRSTAIMGTQRELIAKQKSQIETQAKEIEALRNRLQT